MAEFLSSLPAGFEPLEEDTKPLFRLPDGFEPIEEADDLGLGQQLLEVGKGIPSGAVRLGGTAITGLGALLRGKEREALDLLDRLDRGETVPVQDDPAMLQRLTPEQRTDLRAGIEESVAVPFKETPLAEAGAAVSEFSRELFPAAPGFEESTGRQLGEGLGSVVGGVGFSLLPGGALAGPLVFTFAGSGEAVERAVQAGATEEQIIEAAGLGTIPGMTDSIPVEMLTGRIPLPGGQLFKIPLNMLGKAIKAIGRIGWQATVEGLQEGGQEFLQNMIAQDVYKPEQVLTEGVLPSAGIGSGVGAIAEIGRQLITTAAGGRRRRAAGKREAAAQGEPEITPDDEASPIPTDLIREGRRVTMDAAATSEANEILRRNDLPEVNTRVVVTDLEGNARPGMVADAFSEENDELGISEEGVKIALDDGTMLEEFVAQLDRLGIEITSAGAEVAPAAPKPPKTEETPPAAPVEAAPDFTVEDEPLPSAADLGLEPVPAAEEVTDDRTPEGRVLRGEREGEEPGRPVPEPEGGREAAGPGRDVQAHEQGEGARPAEEGAVTTTKELAAEIENRLPSGWSTHPSPVLDTAVMILNPKGAAVGAMRIDQYPDIEGIVGKVLSENAPEKPKAKPEPPVEGWEKAIPAATAFVRKKDGGKVTPLMLKRFGLDTAQAKRLHDHLRSQGTLTQKGYAHTKLKKPRDVLDIIKQMGGIKPDGDLRAMDLQKVRPGIMRNDGRSVSEVREHLEELGIVPAGAKDSVVYDEISRAIAKEPGRPFHPADEDLVRDLHDEDLAGRDADMLEDATVEVQDAAKAAGWSMTEAETQDAAKAMLIETKTAEQAIGDVADRARATFIADKLPDLSYKDLGIEVEAARETQDRGLPEGAERAEEDRARPETPPERPGRGAAPPAQSPTDAAKEPVKAPIGALDDRLQDSGGLFGVRGEIRDGLLEEAAKRFDAIGAPAAAAKMRDRMGAAPAEGEDFDDLDEFISRIEKQATDKAEERTADVAYAENPDKAREARLESLAARYDALDEAGPAQRLRGKIGKAPTKIENLDAIERIVEQVEAGHKGRLNLLPPVKFVPVSGIVEYMASSDVEKASFEHLPASAHERVTDAINQRLEALAEYGFDRKTHITAANRSPEVAEIRRQLSEITAGAHVAAKQQQALDKGYERGDAAKVVESTKDLLTDMGTPFTRREQAAPPTERTDQGDQFVGLGVAPVTNGDRLEAGARKPLKSGKTQKAPDEGLFDVAGRGQLDLVDQARAAPPKEPAPAPAPAELQTYLENLRSITKQFNARGVTRARKNELMNRAGLQRVKAREVGATTKQIQRAETELDTSIEEILATREPAPTPEKAPAKAEASAGDRKIAARLRDIAEKMQNEIDGKFADRLTNTPKRQRQAGEARNDGNHLKRTQDALNALAGHYEAGTVPKALVLVKTKKAVHELTRTKIEHHGGYYDPGRDTGEPYSDTPAAVALWAMLKGPTREEKTADELTRKLEGVQFSKIPGFFETPAALAQRMVDEAEIESGMSVLEPSAGAGRIADAIATEVDKDTITVVERMSSLREILELKGYTVAESDFMEHTGQYDRIVMNPPFENLQDIDHVRHAYDQLKPGGKMVSIMSPGPFFRDTKKAKEFRDWIEEVGGTVEALPEGTFKESGTGVASRLVVIEKGGERAPAPASKSEIVTLLPGLSEQLIGRAQNWYGRLTDPDLRRRLTAVLENPTQETWDDANTIIIDPRGGPGRGLGGTTLWNAWIAIDPDAPKSKPADGPWPKVPTKDDLVRAFQWALSKGEAAEPGTVTKLEPKPGEKFAARRDRQAPPFFSALLRAAEGLKQEKGTGPQLLATLRKIPGVKEEEIAWTGLDDYLNSRGATTKAEIAEYLRENEIVVEETVKGGRDEEEVGRPVFNEIDRQGIEGSEDSYEITVEEVYTGQQFLITVDPDAGNVHVQDLEDMSVTIPIAAPVNRQSESDAYNAIESYWANSPPGALRGGPTRFGTYTLPGGENYRELLLTLPETTGAGPEPIPLTKLPEEYQVGVDTSQPLSARYHILPPGQAHARPFARRHGTILQAEAAALKELNRQRHQKWFDGLTTFDGGHFDETNVLASVRFNERTDADGKRILFIEEVQSDWHQKGRRQGYTPDPAIERRLTIKRDEAARRLSEAEDLYVAALKDAGLAAQRDGNFEARSAIDFVRDRAIEGRFPPGQVMAAIGGKIPEKYLPSIDKDFGALRDAYVEADRALEAHTRTSFSAVPDAPFKKTWHELVMRRMVRYAAEKGFDSVGWTTGAQQVDRYTEALRKGVDEIRWTKTTDGIHLVGVKRAGLTGDEFDLNVLTEDEQRVLRALRARRRQGRALTDEQNRRMERLELAAERHGSVEVVNTTEKESDLSDAIGKAMGDRIIEDPAQSGVIRGEDIKIDDTGMAVFYDRMMAKAANKIGKKFGAKVGKAQIVTDSPEIAARFQGDISDLDTLPPSVSIHTLDITDAMRETAVSEGFPLFSSGKGKFTPGFAADSGKIYQSLKARLKQVGLSDQIALRLRDKISAVIDGKATPQDGRYVNRLIEVALDSPDQRWTLDHETIHALRDLGVIRPLEWRTLERAAVADAELMDEIRDRYDGFGLTEEDLTEEAVADMFANWAAGRSQVGGALKRAFRRAADFFKALYGALTGRGYEKAEDIFEAVERGEIGRRSPAEPLSREGFLKQVSRRTRLKGAQVFSRGTGAAYDPLGGFLTIGEDVTPNTATAEASADLARTPAPDNWRKAKVTGFLEDGSEVETTAGVAARAIGGRIRKAMAVLGCLG